MTSDETTNTTGKAVIHLVKSEASLGRVIVGSAVELRDGTQYKIMPNGEWRRVGKKKQEKK